MVHLDAATAGPDEVVRISGLVVTSLARTVVDLARASPPEVGVVLADAAQRTGPDPDEVAEVLDRSVRRPGCAKARRALAFADGRAESVGESRSRFAIARAGLPEPAPRAATAARLGQVL